MSALTNSESMRWRWPWILVLGAHLAVAAMLWRLLPHGFSRTNPRFWSNEVLPPLVLAVCAAGLLGVLKNRFELSRFIMTAMAGAYLSMAATWLVCFPVSGKRPALALALFGALLLLIGRWSLRRLHRNRRVALAGAFAGILLGGMLPFSQRGANPATRPVEAFREIANSREFQTTPPAALLPDFVTLSPRSGSLAVRFGKVAVDVEPLLKFVSRSPDRGWTVFANRRQRAGPRQMLAGWRRTADVTTLYYLGAEPAVLRIVPDTANILRIEATTALADDVYSHLNTFCRLAMHGHQRLSITFSPCSEKRIEVRAAQYPIGRPMRFAYLDAQGVFHVVEAASGEKGPFTELARGPLPRGEKLAITIHDRDAPVGRLTFADFSAQASTQPSPTAGWGAPENAIEFSLDADRPNSWATFWITLAGTSVGRGWDSVGHAAGVYHNQIEIERLTADDDSR